MSALNVYQVKYCDLNHIGAIDTNKLAFSYSDDYLRAANPSALSLSLPLRPEPYPESAFRPYFEGLLPEGDARYTLTGQAQLRAEDWTGLLSAFGRDCIGDVVILPEGESLPQERSYYTPLDTREISALISTDESIAKENIQGRLSLAGAQNKTGLAHDPARSMQEGWLRPHGLAATTHLLKTSNILSVPENEFLCMKAARACGINVPNVALLKLARPTLAVGRFDRRLENKDGELVVYRQHQEDLAQALGITPGSKYAELEGGSIACIAELIREHCTQPARDIVHVAQQLCFSFLIGNCDAHLKNYSISYGEGAGKQHIRMSPGYDFVCTTLYPKFSRRLAMRLGNAEEIDEVSPDSLRVLAKDLGITVAALQAIARPIVERTRTAIEAAGDGECGEVIESTPYVADDLLDDIAPREAVLKSFCG